MTNDVPTITHEAIRRYEAEARALRAAYLADGTRALFSAIAAIPARIRAAFHSVSHA